MKITKKAYYAIVACSYMAKNPNNLVSASDIAFICNTTVGFMNLIFSDLRKANIVTTKKGPGGGYKLNIAFTELSVHQILNAVNEKTTDIDEDLRESLSPETLALVNKVHLYLNKQTYKMFSSIKISDFLNG